MTFPETWRRGHYGLEHPLIDCGSESDLKLRFEQSALSLLPPQHCQHDWVTGQAWSLPKGMYVSGIRDQKTQSKGSQSLQDRLEQLTASTDPKVCFGRGIKRPS